MQSQIVTLLAALTIAAGCAITSADTARPATESTGAFVEVCAQFCTIERTCSPDGATADCTAQCQEHLTQQTETCRPSLMTMMQCVSELSCEAYADFLHPSGPQFPCDGLLYASELAGCEL